MKRRLIPLALTAAIAAVTLLVMTTAGAFAEEAASSPEAQASVVSTKNVVPPRKKVVRRHFKPWAKPSTGKVREIIRQEARRWHISAASLARRVNCESRYHWWASNGTYFGVLQFAPSTFYRGLSSIRTHRVRLVRHRTRRVHVVRVSRYSDGTVERRRTTPRRQRVLVVYRGRLPRRPSISHAWAQIRIGAQAIRGISAVHSSEWGCSA